MEHGEAIRMMAAERYLLDELTPEERDAFEEHLFNCSDCALDIRAGATFVTEAKMQLAEIDAQLGAPAATRKGADDRDSRKTWSFLFRPAFALPAFAAMLAVIAFQNVATIPNLRKAATEPRILHSNEIHTGTRGSSHTAVLADRSEGLALTIELPQSSEYSSYSFALKDPGGKQVWSRSFVPANGDSGEDRIVSLVIPAAGLDQRLYSLSIYGITSQGGRVEIDRRVLDVQFSN